MLTNALVLAFGPDTIAADDGNQPSCIRAPHRCGRRTCSIEHLSSTGETERSLSLQGIDRMTPERRARTQRLAARSRA
jgi:hypothetical protein